MESGENDNCYCQQSRHRPDIVARTPIALIGCCRMRGDIARATLDSQLVDGLLTKNAFETKWEKSLAGKKMR